MKFIKKLLPFVLSFLVIFSAFPFSASAATVTNYSFDVFSVTTSDKSYSDTIVDSSAHPGYKSCLVSNITGKLKDFTIEIFDYQDTYNYKLSKGDSIDVELYTLPNYRYNSFTTTVVFYCVDTEGHIFHYARKGTYDKSTGKISFSLTSDYDFSETYLRFIEFTDITLDGSYSNFRFFYKGISATSSSEQSGFFNSVKEAFSNLWQWLQNIINAIKDIPAKMGEFFSDLKTNISNWFNNLIDDLSSFFSDVGNWFTDLGNKIKGFFTDLGNNIKGFFSNLWDNISGTVLDIRDNISNWWQSVTDWFHSLFTPEDGFFEKYKTDWEKWARSHFGALYQSFEIIQNLTSSFSLDGSSNNASITIPEIRLPFFNHPVILESKTFSFASIINNNNSMIYYLFSLFKLIVSVIFYGLLLKYLYKTFTNIFGMNEGDE